MSMIKICIIAPLLICTTSAINVLASPQIACDVVTFDFGERSSDQPIEHQFILKNKGNQPLMIQQVKTSCGCTATKLESNKIEPGASVPLNVSAKLKARTGIQRKSIRVISNDPQTPELKLAIEGQVTAPVMLDPYRLYLGNSRPGQIIEKTVKILADSNQVQITRLEIMDQNNIPLPMDHANWQVLLDNPKDGQGYVLNVRAVTPKKLGKHDVVIAVHTDHSKMPMVKLPVSVKVSGALSVAPDKLVVVQEAGKKQKSQSRYLSIRRTDRKDRSPFEITKITPPNEFIAVEIKPMGKTAYRIKVSNLAPQELTGESFLKIETNVPDMKTIEIPVQIYQRG